jgi:hypothetical protein
MEAWQVCQASKIFLINSLIVAGPAIIAEIVSTRSFASPVFTGYDFVDFQLCRNRKAPKKIQVAFHNYQAAVQKKNNYAPKNNLQEMIYVNYAYRVMPCLSGILDLPLQLR